MKWKIHQMGLNQIGLCRIKNEWTGRQTNRNYPHWWREDDVLFIIRLSLHLEKYQSGLAYM